MIAMQAMLSIFWIISQFTANDFGTQFEFALGNLNLNP